MPTSCSVHGRHHPLVEGKNAENRVARIVRALHRLEGKQVSVRVRNGVSVPPVLLGLTHIQSISGLAVCVPFVSMAISNPTLWTASIRGWSNCRRGSPPVHTTNGLEYPRYAARFSRLRRPRSPQYRNVLPRFHQFQQSPYHRTGTPPCSDLLHVLTKGCNPRTGKKRQVFPFEHPRLATCRRSLLLHSSCWYLGETISGWIDDASFQKSLSAKLARVARSTCFSNS